MKQTQANITWDHLYNTEYIAAIITFMFHLHAYLAVNFWLSSAFLRLVKMLTVLQIRNRVRIRMVTACMIKLHGPVQTTVHAATSVIYIINKKQSARGFDHYGCHYAPAWLGRLKTEGLLQCDFAMLETPDPKSALLN